MPDDRPGLRDADVPAWRNPTPLERLEQAVRGQGRPSPERRRLAEGLAALGSMLPGPGTAEAMAMLRRGDDGDYIGGGRGRWWCWIWIGGPIHGRRAKRRRRSACGWPRHPAS